MCVMAVWGHSLPWPPQSQSISYKIDLASSPFLLLLFLPPSLPLPLPFSATFHLCVCVSARQKSTQPLHSLLSRLFTWSIDSHHSLLPSPVQAKASLSCVPFCLLAPAAGNLWRIFVFRGEKRGRKTGRAHNSTSALTPAGRRAAIFFTLSLHHSPLYLSPLALSLSLQHPFFVAEHKHKKASQTQKEGGKGGRWYGGERERASSSHTTTTEREREHGMSQNYYGSFFHLNTRLTDFSAF